MASMVFIKYRPTMAHSYMSTMFCKMLKVLRIQGQESAHCKALEGDQISSDLNLFIDLRATCKISL